MSGDGLRVVDGENNRGLIVDQTIEKVSFCAPDRNNEKGFAYICRDGTSRRWMCHGFHATKETVRLYRTCVLNSAVKGGERNTGDGGVEIFIHVRDGV